MATTVLNPCEIRLARSEDWQVHLLLSAGGWFCGLHGIRLNSKILMNEYEAETLNEYLSLVLFPAAVIKTYL